MVALQHKIREYKEAAVLHKDRLHVLRQEIIALGETLGLDYEQIEIVFEVYGGM